MVALGRGDIMGGPRESLGTGSGVSKGVEA